MKLVLLAKSTPAHRFGGVETHAELLARSAARLGHDVLLVTTAHPRGITHAELGGARVVYLNDVASAAQARAWWARSAAAVERKLRDDGVDLVISLGMSGYGLAETSLGVRHHSVAYGDGLSHVISEWHDSAGVRGVARFPRRALATLYYGWLERRMWRRVDGVLATDERLYERLRRLGYRTRLFYTGIEVADFAPNAALRQSTRAQLGIPAGARVILVVGTVNRQKGMWLVADVVSALAADRPALHLLVVGDGPDRAALSRGLEASMGRGRAHFTGALPHARIPACGAASDVFFFPTLRVEGVPFAVLEAMSAGLPIVAANRGGIATAIEHEVTGLLAPPGDRPALRQALARVLDDPALAASLGRRARARALDRFDLDATTARLLADLGPERH